MIEIKYSGDTWECWIDGSLWDWHDDLASLLSKIGRNAEEIKEDIYSSM